MTIPTFDRFALDPRLVEAVTALGFAEPTPIQLAAIPPLLEGRDLIGSARTGSGKTAAFGLPLLHRVAGPERHVKALVLVPTRELALQVTAALRSFGEGFGPRVVTVYGGASYTPQLRALSDGVPVVVGTPGRVLDLLGRGALDLSMLEQVVLDEADEMLRMGFIDDVEAILEATPRARQVALLSATMPDRIRSIAKKHLHDPVIARVEEEALTVHHIEQRWMRVPTYHKIDALIRVLDGEPRATALVFARTRAGCAEAADELARRGVPVDALHGDLNQAARERVLARLRSQQLDVVVATDVAARGIDIDHITHVINFDLPDDTEGYVHRIGRTGRAGRKGVAITLVTPKQKRRIHELARELGVEITPMEVPSDADLLRRQVQELHSQVASAFDADLGPARPLMDALLTDGNDPFEIALAALVALAEANGVPMGSDPTAEPPSWARPVQGQGGPTEDLNEVELFFPVGRTNGVRPADLVGAIAGDTDIPGRLIGRITILDRKSFVGLPRALAEQVLEGFRTINVRGVDVAVDLARPRTGRSARGPRKPWQNKRKGSRRS